MRILAIFLLCLTIQGCTGIIAIGNCIDGVIPRLTSTPNEKFIITVENTSTGEIIKKPLECEENYNSQCSVRGNYWSWRSVDPDSDITFLTNDNTKVDLKHANCETLVEGDENEINKFRLSLPALNKHIWQNKKDSTYFYIQKINPRIDIQIDVPPMVLTVKKI